MTTRICIDCGHQFPETEAELSAEPGSMVVLVAAGILAAIAGVAMVVTFFAVGGGIKALVFGVLFMVMGGQFVGSGLQCGKGIKAICPSCTKPLGFPIESNDGKHFLKRQAREQAKQT